MKAASTKTSTTVAGRTGKREKREGAAEMAVGSSVLKAPDASKASYRWRPTALAVAPLLVALLGGCSKPNALAGVAPEERAALEKLASTAGVAANSIELVSDVSALKAPPDAPNVAIAVRDGHVVGLRISDTSLASMAGVAQLSGLTSLDLHGNRIAQIEGLSALSKLESLDVSHNALNKIEGLDASTGLHELALASNHIARIEGVATLKELRVLNLSLNAIDAISGLDTLASLTWLSLSGNPIARIEGVADHAALTYLNLGYCQIAKAENLTGLPQLVTLQLWHNRLTQIDGFEALPALRYVGVGENPINFDTPENRRVFDKMIGHTFLARW